MWAYVLDCDVAVLSLGMLCDEEGVTYSWVPNDPPTLIKDDCKVTCYPSHNVPIIFPAALLAEGDLKEDEPEEGWTEAKGKRAKKAAVPAAAEGDFGETPKRRSRP